jgi:drug/metabolite transporter (DMT)-like permease
MTGRMRPRDVIELVALAALWGGSFLFMRMSAAEVGPVALVAVRVTGAALLLLPLLAQRGQWSELGRHWRPILFVGITNSALPFLCFAYAALSITAGLSSLFNATAPLFAALIAWAWLGDRLSALRWLGIVISMVGVASLVWSNVNTPAAFRPGGSGWAVVVCIAATMCYGIAANFAKRRLGGVPPLAVAAGSQAAAALCLAVPAWLWWPAKAPGPVAWGALAMLAFACTGVAYLLFFRLIANAGPSNALAVTYLVPLFAVLWGWLFLGETVTPAMLAAGGVVLLGTALATGMIDLRRPNARAVRA